MRVAQLEEKAHGPARLGLVSCISTNLEGFEALTAAPVCPGTASLSDRVIGGTVTTAL